MITPQLVVSRYNELMGHRNAFARDYGNIAAQDIANGDMNNIISQSAVECAKADIAAIEKFVQSYGKGV